MLRLALKPRWLGFLALVLLLVTAFVMLSAWQIDRAQSKSQQADNPELAVAKPFNDIMEAQGPMPGYLADQRVTISGHFLPDQQVVIDDRYLNRTKGYWVVTMFAPDDPQFAQAADTDQLESKPVAIPVVRGWTEDLETAKASTASDKDVTLDARIAPVEGPLDTKDLPEGVVRSISTSQIVNLFDVYTYSAFLFPQEKPEVGIGGDQLSYVPYQEPQDEGFDLQSAFYALEWIVFAVFAVYIWFRLLRDEYNALRREDQAPVEYVVVKDAGEKLPRTPKNGDPQ